VRVAVGDHWRRRCNRGNCGSRGEARHQREQDE
jgi:hypothetical protein